MTILLALVALALLVVLLVVLIQMRVEMRGVAERMTAVERSQTLLPQSVSTLQGDISDARTRLEELRAQAQVRAGLDQQVADSVRRLETIIAGTQSKGEAGENILEVVLSKLPTEWQVRDFTVGNKTVEFGLRLPNNRILPIDSKWPATSLLENLARCTDLRERRQLKEQIENTVRMKAREVRKYLDPDLTLSFGIAAVPDAVYDLCTSVQTDCFEQKVVLVGYSMFIPYLLLVFQTVLEASRDIDLERLERHLNAMEDSVNQIQKELQGRFATGLTMVNNSRDEINRQANRISTGLVTVRQRSAIGDMPVEHDLSDKDEPGLQILTHEG